MAALKGPVAVIGRQALFFTAIYFEMKRAGVAAVRI